jgi:hypothetical protein
VNSHKIFGEDHQMFEGASIASGKIYQIFGEASIVSGNSHQIFGEGYYWPVPNFPLRHHVTT